MNLFKIGDLVYFKIDLNKTMMCVAAVFEKPSGIKLTVTHFEQRDPCKFGKLITQTIDSRLVNKKKS